MVSMSKMASNIFNNSTHNNTNRTTLTATKMNLTHYKLTPSLYTYIHNVHPERNAWYRPHPTIISPNKYDLQHTHPFPLCTSRKKKIKTHPQFVFTRLPLFQGAYGGYIIPLLTLLEVDPNKCKIRPSLQGTGKYMRGHVWRSIKSVKVIISMHRPMYNYT